MDDVVEPSEEPAAQLGRRARKALATRQALFEAGLEAFENRPLGLVSVLDLTEAADVAKGVFYLHFGSKDEYLIRLWEFVQLHFLDALRQRVSACRSRRSRLETAVRHYWLTYAEDARACRFWLRMSSYFGEEIGQPGQLGRSRMEYFQRLAALVGGVTLDEVGGEDLRSAGVLDGACWGLVSHAIHHGEEGLDQDSFERALAGALRSLTR